MVVETTKAPPVSEEFLAVHGIFGAFSEMTMAAVFSARLRGAFLFSVTRLTPK